ncbi:cysteine-rich receptor-like protein kinase 44 [Rutidosis leptorrhynchoides]|uniref:cysteine-rich receptor-like protein kinase 44 n=1 Tax=Rutidosis leptorrhynchoides TaxID=125765 RepID=UPI003A99C38D
MATDNFSEKYHHWYEGDHQVYKAELEHFEQEMVEENNKSEPPKRHITVLIKRLVTKEGLDKYQESFRNEIEMLTTCNHRNIVTLLGFCDENSEMILVFYKPFKISLGTFLMDLHKPIFTWAQRLRMCLDIAFGLEYLHYGMEDQKAIIHRDITCNSIILDENLEARIANFGISVFLPPYQKDHTLYLKTVTGPYGHVDPEYVKTGKLKRESDVYSFGVILFEILWGKTVRSHFKDRGEKLLYEVQRCIREGNLKDMLDPIIKEESSDGFTLNRGPNQNSLDAFLEIAVACLVETQDKRPTIKVVIEELQKALLLQENNKDTLRISLEAIKLATNNFHVDNCVGRGGFGKVYKGKLPQIDNIIVAKQLDTKSNQGDKEFRNELQILYNCKHNNIISLVGYCDEKDAKVIIYEYAAKGSLYRYLSDARLNWMKRLKICIGLATALNFLHTGIGKQATVIHRDIKPDNILITYGWNEKLGDFGLSLICAINNETDYVIDRACGTAGYFGSTVLGVAYLNKRIRYIFIWSGFI